MSFLQINDDSDFSLDNLPYGIFTTAGNERKRIGVAIGTWILDLSTISHLFQGPLMRNNQASQI